MNYIFGYGSLISPLGINGRNMSRVYTKNDLTPALLYGCRREWNAVYKGQKYLGLIIGLEPLFNFANGVIFQISDEDLPPFLESEGIGSQFHPPMYELKNVTKDIITSRTIHPEDNIFTCVTLNPTPIGSIPKHYMPIIEHGLNLWGPEFRTTFLNTTFLEILDLKSQST